MSKKLLFAILFGAIIVSPVFVFAQFFDLPPDNIRTMVMDEDWKEAYCLEAKAQGGWAVSRIQGFAEAIRKPLEDFQGALSLYNPDDWRKFQNSPVVDFYGSFSDYDNLRWSGELPAQDANYYDGLAETIKMDLNEICGAETLEQTIELINKFVSDFADEPTLAVYVGNYFKAEIQPYADRLEDAILGNINEIIEQNRSNYDSLRLETQQKLQAQADREIARREIDAQARIKNEVEQEIQKRAYDGEFGIPPDFDQSALKAATNALISQKSLEANQRIEAELTEKYSRLAMEEEERMENEMIASVEEFNWRDFNKVREEFGDIKNNAVSNANKIYDKDWMQFYTDAYNKKKEIITAILDAQVNQAKNWITSHRSEIEKSREAVVKEGLDFPTVEEMLNRLESEKQSLIFELAGDPLAFHNVNTAAASLEAFWGKVRLIAENAENRTTYQLLSQALSFIDNPSFMNRLKYEGDALRHWRDNFNAASGKKRDECRQMGYDDNFNKRNIPFLRSIDYYLYDVNFPGENNMKMYDYFKKYFDDRLILKQVSNLDEAEKDVGHYVDMPWFCNAFLDQESDINSFEKDLETAYQIQQRFLNTLNEFKNYNSRTPAEELLAYKDRLIEAKNAYLTIDDSLNEYNSYFSYRRRGWRENGSTLEKLSLMKKPGRYEGGGYWFLGSRSDCRTFKNTIYKNNTPNSYREYLCFPQYQKK